VPLNAIKPFLKDLRVVDVDTLENTPYVVAIEQNHLRGTPGHFIYVRGLTAQAGAKYAVVRPTHVYRQFGDDDDYDRVGHMLESNVDMVNGPWKEMTRGDGHWGKGDALGHEVQVIATAQYLRDGDPSTLLIDDANMEVRAGDRIMPVDAQPYDANFYPHTPASLPTNFKVIAFADAMHAAGPHQVVALSAGSAEGIDNGSTFAIFQPGEKVLDKVISSHSDRTFGHKVQLPAEYIGHVMVFRTFEHVSYGLIMDGIRPVKLGDNLRKPS
ncbi:MAG: peptidoglycan-binding protein, partial [Xanthomonadales bacterium]|nr:peptidoglycan-binding protein [Xanthomonadales bacterium]